eukprot:Colp12_sorted_trinity150504_noHs@1302
MAMQGMPSMPKDTTYTKLFVGGLPYHTTSDKLKEYFSQFGMVEEAVVIMDKSTQQSKGYGFVNFVDPAAAAQATADPNPIIDGRKANCNLAYVNAKPRAAPGPFNGAQAGGFGGNAGYMNYGNYNQQAMYQQYMQQVFALVIPFNSPLPTLLSADAANGWNGWYGWQHGWQHG